MDPKEQHEDQALAELVDELNARGRKAAIVRHPDRDKLDTGLTVDAIIQIDGRDWAVDHFLLSRSSDLPPARAAGERELQPRLDAVAQTHKTGLLVSYLPQSKEKYSAQQIQDYYNHVVKVAEDAAATRSFVGSDDGFTTGFRSMARTGCTWATLPESRCAHRMTCPRPSLLLVLEC